ncbi:PREDICTED: ubiquitin carboxyl-terminal hydrolase 24-like isoform X2 [Ipomoea nil]|uniref:ubiquitin carboxyl-terminal hydrolase 24-like isoform X2 n=1 Tax=Ipomoea nil TaxID=35883 RepID=UPI000901DA55|nr:PREDICTED: ubiquitin carboxyl-terminal hydrolase 24-like isoform X2 [Ipomoea nil]
MEVFIFGSFTEDEIRSLQGHPMKNDVEITFGSLDSATLRSVGILNSNPTKVDYSRGAQPSKVFSKENSKNTSGSTEKATIPVIFSQENGSIGGSDLGYHSTAHEVKPCNKAHQLLSSEGSSVTPKESSIKQESTVNVTNLSTSLDGVSLGESKDFNVGNCRQNVVKASNGPVNTIIYLLPRGLVNLGNLCFLCATLQALLSCAPFVQLLQELRTRDIPETGYPALRAFVEFISDFDMPLKSNLKRKDLVSMETGKPFRPLMFESVLKCFTPDVPNSLTGRPRQEDAQEFLSFIMHQMHDELLKLEGQLPNGVGRNSSLVSSVHVDDDENWETVGPRNRTAITRTQSFVPSKLSEIFGGQLKSIVKARGNKASATVQPFMLLHLNICPDPVCTIEDALRLFSAPETLEGYRTSADGKAEVVSASKSVKILELSDIMVLHLMRFSYGSEGSTKLHKPVHFPLELVFGRDLLVSPHSEGRRYELVATITHHGMDPFKGHYTADARHPSGKWLRYDDAAVTPIPTSKVLHEQAYILFYKQL